MADDFSEKGTAQAPAKKRPLPLSRRMAKEIFGIDADIPLPPMEFDVHAPIPGKDRDIFIWRCIVPAAFSWYHFFETTHETRWGLNQAGYNFDDCKDAIYRAILCIGIPPEEAEMVIRGALRTAYSKFKVPTLAYYRPCVRIRRTFDEQDSRWARKTEEQKQWALARQRALARIRASVRVRRNHGTSDKMSGRPRVLAPDTLEELERMWAEKRISESYYHRLRREMNGLPQRPKRVRRT